MCGWVRGRATPVPDFDPLVYPPYLLGSGIRSKEQEGTQADPGTRHRGPLPIHIFLPSPFSS